MEIPLENIERRKLQLKRLLNSESKNFDERIEMNAGPSVYAVYTNSNIIYVGFTERPLIIRFRELFADPRSHTLHKKLLKEFETSEAVRKFLKSRCKFKALEFENEREARLLEHFAISILDTKYNK